MSRKANPALIGGFVVGAIALALISILVFGSGRFFQSTSDFVLFFPSDVNGLEVGAPVKFKGVDIGSVTDIRLRFGDVRLTTLEQVQQGIRIPVFIQIDNEKFQSQGGVSDLRDPKVMHHLVELGLRGQLNTQSLLTGKLFVQLDFFPDTPATLMAPPGTNLIEIPTVPTKLEQVQSAAERIIQRLQELHLDKMVETATDTLDRIRDLVGNPAVEKTVKALPGTLANVNEAVTELRSLTTRVDTNQEALFAALDSAAEKTTQALDQARGTLASVQGMVGPDGAISGQLSATLSQMQDAARSIRLLADSLERNPSSLIRGREVDKR
jgi:paraquat-inducible protein B